MTYIGIEGSSYVGKTTTINELRDRGYSIIPEYDQFGPFPGSDNSFNGLCGVIEHLINLERRRTVLLGSSAVRGEVFSDRTPISFLTFEEMRSLTANTANQQEVHDKVSDYAKTRLISEISKGNIVLPDGIVVMELSVRGNFEDRVKERGVTGVYELARFDIQRYIANRAMLHAAELVGESRAILIQGDNADTENIADDMVELAGRISEITRNEAKI